MCSCRSKFIATRGRFRFRVGRPGPAAQAKLDKLMEEAA